MKLVKEEFLKRKKANPRYSMRAFASALGVSHSLLSLVLSGKRKPSPRFQKLCKNALLDSAVRSHRSRGRVEAKYDQSEFKVLKETEFNDISTWLHYALLSYFEIPDCSLNPSDIASVLQVSTDQIAGAIDHLKQVGMIGVDSQGRLRQVTPPITFDNRKPHMKSSGFILSVLKKVEHSVYFSSFFERDLRATVFAMRKEDCDYARECIAAFRRKLVAELEMRAQGQPNSVYLMNTNLVPLIASASETREQLS